ncbi:hypothetical protein Dimus_036684 [Dionaea muscipula]
MIISVGTVGLGDIQNSGRYHFNHLICCHSDIGPLLCRPNGFGAFFADGWASRLLFIHMTGALMSWCSSSQKFSLLPFGYWTSSLSADLFWCTIISVPWAFGCCFHSLFLLPFCFGCTLVLVGARR